MNPNALIDAVVRQTTVLIAHLATATGVRAPLAHVAQQVFVELVSELRAQGVGRKVIADMFGMALRTYHARLERLNESVTERGTTLWGAVHRYIGERGTVSRADVLRRFRNDDEDTVKGVLTDLVDTGLVYRTGRGERAVYRMAELDEAARAAASDPAEVEATLVWVGINRFAPCDEAALVAALKLDAEVVSGAVRRLLDSGRAQRGADGLLRCDACVIPVGATVGWEAAVFDHYQAVVSAVCRKLRAGQVRSRFDDACGGSTYGFDVWPGHPHEDEVRTLLARERGRLSDLRARVDAYNAAQERPSDAVRVLYYCGQTVVDDDPVLGHSDGDSGDET